MRAHKTGVVLIFIINFLILIPVLIFSSKDLRGSEFFHLPSSKSIQEDSQKIEEGRQKCELSKYFLVQNKFRVDCFTNYQHYWPSVRYENPRGIVKIAEYNILHPGTSKTLFKDYSLVAKIMNNFDLVSTLEVLETLGQDEINNRAVLSFLEKGPRMILDLQSSKMKQTAPLKLKEIEARINKIQGDLNIAQVLYRAPGYLKLLSALKTLDPSWGLILSPRGDSALTGNVEERVGFFYRGNSVWPIPNPHCNEFKSRGGGDPYACLLNLGPQFMGKDYAHYLSRRPFMASFHSGNFNFTMVSSHIVFTFSGGEELEKNMLRDVFNTNSLSDLGPGINTSNFARFAEVKITLDFIYRYKEKYKDKNIIFGADTNLTANNPYWKEILKNYPEQHLLIDNPTTISPPRYLANGAETNGVANSYDHFILDQSVFSNCNNGDVYNYYRSDIRNDIEATYGIRSHLQNFTDEEENINNEGDIPPADQELLLKLDYPLTKEGKEKMDFLIKLYSNQLERSFTIKNNQVVVDDLKSQEKLEGLRRRLFLNQLTNPFYYRFYQELLSDHFPISISCRN